LGAVAPGEKKMSLCLIKNTSLGSTGEWASTQVAWFISRELYPSPQSVKGKST